MLIQGLLFWGSTSIFRNVVSILPFFNNPLLQALMEDFVGLSHGRNIQAQKDKKYFSAISLDMKSCLLRFYLRWRGRFSKVFWIVSDSLSATSVKVLFNVGIGTSASGQNRSAAMKSSSGCFRLTGMSAYVSFSEIKCCSSYVMGVNP